MIRTRFAPSPTGYLHIGGARTCLFNWLFARANKGTFILRIEDTDKVRSQKEYLDEILNSITWLGLNWDELYFQSQRFDLYRSSAEKLLAEGKAYKAEDGLGAIILKMPQKIVKINDLIHGEIQFDTSTIKDQVLIKSDGSPTYNFACVVDDADLKLTHILRGDDHISNTPKQIIIYEALGLPLPEFAHIPMINAEAGGRLSKRKGATAVSEYKNMGFLSQAIINYLSLLGWSPGNDQEIISLEDSIKKFSIKDINNTAAAFNMDKLEWINNYYIKNMEPEKLLDIAIPLWKEKGIIIDDNFDRNWLINLVKLFKERVNTLNELVDWSEFFFAKDLVLNEDAKKKLEEKDLSKEFAILREDFSKIDTFDHLKIEEVFRSTVDKLGLKTKVLIHPLRAALTGMLIGPGLFEVVAVLGKDTVCKRIDKAINMMAKSTNKEPDE